MKTCFADTYFYLALLNPDDEAHEAAVALNRELTTPMVTTAWVLTEVGDALAAPGH
jgi:predicted nucleic acid-binding protein